MAASVLPFLPPLSLLSSRPNSSRFRRNHRDVPLHSPLTLQTRPKTISSISKEEEEEEEEEGEEEEENLRRERNIDLSNEIRYAFLTPPSLPRKSIFEEAVIQDGWNVSVFLSKKEKKKERKRKKGGGEGWILLEKFENILKMKN